MVRWFPDRRGFAAGMVAAGYGMGAIVTTFPISASIDSSGYQTTLLLYGLIFGVVGVLAAQGLRPAPTLAATPETSQSGVATEASDFLDDVPDDVADVDIGADGHLADGQLCR